MNIQIGGWGTDRLSETEVSVNTWTDGCTDS